LACAKFAYNNSKHGITLFFANQGHHPRAVMIEETAGTPIDEPAAAYVEEMRVLFKTLKTTIESAQGSTARYYNKIWKPITFQVGDQV